MLPSVAEVAHIPVTTTDTVPGFTVVEIIGDPIFVAGLFIGDERYVGYTTQLYMLRTVAHDRGADAVVGLVISDYSRQHDRSSQVNHGIMAVGTAVKIVPTEGEV